MLLHGMAGQVVAATRADQVVGPDDLLAPVFIEGHRDAPVIGHNRCCFRAELDLKALPGQMVAQSRLRKPLGLAALELVFASQASELVKPNSFQIRTQELNLPDAHAAREKRGDDPALVEDLKDRRLECGSPRLVMGRSPSFHDPRFYAVTKEFARSEKARRTRADDEDLSIEPRVGVSGFLRHSGFPQSFTEL
jgi:hypothetical protein